MIALTYDRADGFVAKLQRKGVDVRWEGWNIIFFKEDRRALRATSGKRWGERWGFETVVEPNGDGRWLVDYKLARGTKIATG